MAESSLPSFLPLLETVFHTVGRSFIFANHVSEGNILPIFLRNRGLIIHCRLVHFNPRSNLPCAVLIALKIYVGTSHFYCNKIYLGMNALSPNLGGCLGALVVFQPSFAPSEPFAYPIPSSRKQILHSQGGQYL